jgi:hypothetical protein
VVSYKEGWPILHTSDSNVKEVEASSRVYPASYSVGIWGSFPGNEMIRA